MNILKDNNKPLASSGWCFIMSGGPGSGKSTFINQQILQSGKCFNIDEIELKLIRLYEKKGLPIPGDLKEKTPRLASSLEKIFLKVRENKKTFLDNVFIDICGGPATAGGVSVTEMVGQLFKSHGYKVGLCWVICNRNVALKRNLQRERIVPETSFHKKHDDVNSFLPLLLKSPGSVLDAVWICFTSSYEYEIAECSSSIFQLKKGNNGFIIPALLENRIIQTLGRSKF